VLVHLSFCTLLLGAACYDLSSFRIPNWISVALVVLFFGNGLLQLPQLAWSTHMLAGAVTLAAGFGLYGSGIMGAGDVKLIAATSLWFGLSLLPLFLVIMALAGVGTAIALVLIRRVVLDQSLPGRSRLPAVLAVRGRVPYGVAIALASIVVSAYLPDEMWQF
jgi:prepilin peptidase CpaA